MNECHISKVVLVVQQPSYIGEVIGKAIVIAKIANAVVHFSFNGIAMVVTKFDSVGHVLDFYDSKVKENV
jgi:hypothetical protein